MQLGVHTTLTHLPDTPTLFISDDVLSNPCNLQRLGKGAFGQVFKYTKDNLSIALKCLPILSDGVATEVNEIIKEVAVHGALLHKNIVHYVGCYRGKDNLFIFLEYMENGSLKDKLHRLEKERNSDDVWNISEPLLACEVIMRYTRDILNGLLFLHSKNIIHRDIRSPNILLSALDVAKIGDFGLCKEIHKLALNSLFTASSSIGNVFFRAPEMIDTGERMRIGGRAVDVWSLGILILEMVYHVPPFAREKGSEIPYMFRLCVLKKLPEIPDCLSDEVKNLLGKCLVFDAAERASTGQLLNEFYPGHEDHVEESIVDADSPKRPRARSRRPGLSHASAFFSSPPVRQRKTGLCVDQQSSGHMSDSDVATAERKSPQPRSRRRPGVCHSPHEITEKFLFS